MGEHGRLASAERTLEVAPHDDRDQRVVGAALVPGQSETDAIQRGRIERAAVTGRLARRIGRRLAAGDQRFVATGPRGLLGRARELLIDDLGEHRQRLAAAHRATIDEERRRARHAEPVGVDDVGRDRCAEAVAVEIGAEPHHVEADLARDQLDRRAIDAAAEREQPIVHRPEPALRVGGERSLGAERLVLVERQRAMHPAQLAGIQPRQVIERGLHAIAVLAGVVAPRDDRDRRIARTAARRIAERDLVHRRRIEAGALGARACERRRVRDEASEHGEHGEHGPGTHHSEATSSAASSRPRGPVPVAARRRPPGTQRPPSACASSIRR
jgi:hypothetical protein